MKKASNGLSVRISAFLTKHRKLSFLILILIISVCGIALAVANLKILAAIPFGFSLICLIRLITHKEGRIPFISVDKTYQSIKAENLKEDAEEKYKEFSINSATVYFIIVVFSFPLWIIAELLKFIL